MSATSNHDDHSHAEGEHDSQQQAHAPSAGKLFVGQVPAVCTEDMLRPVFLPFGQIIEIKIMRDAPGGRSKGCAWVKYATREQAQAAIDSLHEKHTIPPQTNTLQVRFAEEKGARAAQQQQQQALQQQQQQAEMGMMQSSSTAFVGNLPANTPAETLREFIVPLLPPNVAVKEVNVPAGKLFGFLTFETAAECHAAVSQLTASPPTFNGNLLRVQSARPRAPSARDNMNAMMAGGYGGPQGRGFMMPQMDPSLFFGRGGGYPPFGGGYPMGMGMGGNPYMGMGMGGNPFGYGVMPPQGGMGGYGGGGGGGSGGGRGRGRGGGGSWNR